MLDQLEKYFQENAFITGGQLSVADLFFVATFKDSGIKIDGNKNLTKYMSTVSSHKEYQGVNVGSLKQSKAESVKPSKAEPVKSSKAEPVKSSTAESNTDLMESLEKAKPKDPFAVLPPTTFDFDDYKRRYSNNPPEDYLPYFWEKFDAENCSIWLCDYKFNNELGLAFMSSNLIRGALQRLDKARKQSFGSMAVYGKDGDNLIAGLWVWRGQDLMFKLTEDWQVDYESFDWKKLDPKSDETKKLVELFFKQSEDSEYKGKKYNDGKIFK